MKQKKNLKTMEIKVRVSEADYRDMQSGMERLGITNRAEFIRLCIRSPQVRREAALQKEFKELAYQVRKAGTNLNQITKNINSGFFYPDYDLANGCIRDVRLLLEEVLLALSKLTGELDGDMPGAK